MLNKHLQNVTLKMSKILKNIVVLLWRSGNHQYLDFQGDDMSIYLHKYY